MNSVPLVSFVVPCYNYGRFLEKCVNSILRQDYENLEILIMDNCSSDNTPEVARSFKDPRVKHVRNDSNIGAVRNFNKGLTLSQGKYVWVLSADDLLRSDSVVRRYVDVMEKNEDLGFVFCRAIELQGEKERGVFKWADGGERDCIWHDATFFLRLIDSCCAVLSSVMMRKESLDSIGLFPVDLPYSDDWYVLSALALRYGVAYFAEPMVYCRFHDETLTNQQGREFGRICAADGLTVLWRVGQEAEAAGRPDLHDACVEGIIRLARTYLKTYLWGTGPRMSATEFEETLTTRIQRVESIRFIIGAVYTRLAEDVRSLQHVHDAPIDLADEVSAYWGLWFRAKLAGVRALCDACEQVLAHRLSYRIQDGTLNVGLGASRDSLTELLYGRISDQAAAKRLRVLIYRDLAEEQFTRGEYAGTTLSYRLALSASPGDPGIRVKYLLMRMGAPGIWIRHMVHQIRESVRTC